MLAVALVPLAPIKFGKKMAMGNSKKRGLMPGHGPTRHSALAQTAQSGGERQVERVRRPSVNLRGAALEIPGNRWSVALWATTAEMAATCV